MLFCSQESVGLIYVGPDVWRAMLNAFRYDLSHAFQPEFGVDAAGELMARTAGRMVAALLPFFGILLAVGIAASVAQVGFQINTEKLTLDFDKLNPANGATRLFSVGALVRGGLTS